MAESNYRVAVHRAGPRDPFGQRRFECRIYSRDAWARFWMDEEIADYTLMERKNLFDFVERDLIEMVAEHDPSVLERR